MQIEVTSEYVQVDGLRAFKTTPRLGTGGVAGGMLLLPMITGIGSQVRQFANAISQETRQLVLAWDPWHGKSSDDTEHADLAALHDQLDDASALAEQGVLLQHLRDDLQLASVGVIGWCLGGRFGLVLGATHRDISKVISLHPTVPADRPSTQDHDVVALAADIQSPVLLAYPGKDSIVPRTRFLGLQEALQSRAQAPTIVHLYPEAKHGFSDERRHNEAVNARAWSLLWPQVLAFISTTA